MKITRKIKNEEYKRRIKKRSEGKHQESVWLSLFFTPSVKKGLVCMWFCGFSLWALCCLEAGLPGSNSGVLWRWENPVRKHSLSWELQCEQADSVGWTKQFSGRGIGMYTVHDGKELNILTEFRAGPEYQSHCFHFLGSLREQDYKFSPAWMTKIVKFFMSNLVRSSLKYAIYYNLKSVLIHFSLL